MKRPFSNGNISGTVQSHIGTTGITATIELDVKEQYWTTKWWVLPVKRVRTVKRKFYGRRVGNRVKWFDEKHENVHDNYFDDFIDISSPLILMHFEGMFTELEYEHNIEQASSVHSQRMVFETQGDVGVSDQEVFVAPTTEHFFSESHMQTSDHSDSGVGDVYIAPEAESFTPEPVEDVRVSHIEPYVPPSPEPSYSSDDDSTRRSSSEAPAPSPEPSYSSDSFDSGSDD